MDRNHKVFFPRAPAHSPYLRDMLNNGRTASSERISRDGRDDFGVALSQGALFVVLYKYFKDNWKRRIFLVDVRKEHGSILLYGLTKSPTSTSCSIYVNLPIRWGVVYLMNRWKIELRLTRALLCGWLPFFPISPPEFI